MVQDIPKPYTSYQSPVVFSLPAKRVFHEVGDTESNVNMKLLMTSMRRAVRYASHCIILRGLIIVARC